MEELIMLSGIYKITNLTTSQIYIGSSVDVRRRMMKHKSLLKRGDHHSIFLQRSWDKYGEEAFDFELILKVPETSALLENEQKFIDDLKPEFNMCPIAGNRLGYKHTDETKSILAEKSKGNTNFKGRKHTDATKEKMRQHHLGKKMSDESKEKMRQHHLGKKRPEAVKKKISETMKGQKYRRAINDEVKISEIRKKLSEGQSRNSLAKEYGVSKTVIRNIHLEIKGY
jgi:group I intron endonuclease